MHVMADFREILRITLKAKEVGRDGLEPWERETLESFEKAVAPAVRELNHPETQEGYRIWESFPPERREQYADWTPRQLYAFKLLIDDLDAPEGGPK
jgi:hypothetical protein